MIGYVKIKTPESLFPQLAVPTGKRDGHLAEFIPISKGHYRTKFWAAKNQLAI